MIKFCRKLCYSSRAKARKKIKKMSGYRHHKLKMIYLCEQPHHAGAYHVSSRRVPHAKKENAMDQDEPSEVEEQEEEGNGQHGPDVQAVQDPALEQGAAPLRAQEVSDPCRGHQKSAP